MEVRNDSQVEAQEMAEADAEAALEAEQVDEYQQELFETLTQLENHEQLMEQNGDQSSSKGKGAETLLDYWKAQEEHRSSLQQVTERSAAAESDAAEDASESDSDLSFEDQDLFGRFETALKKNSPRAREQIVQFLFDQRQEEALEDEYYESMQDAIEAEAIEQMEIDQDLLLEQDYRELLEDQRELNGSGDGGGDSGSGGHGHGGSDQQKRSRGLWAILEAARERNLAPIASLQGGGSLASESLQEEKVVLPDAIESRFAELERALQTHRQKAETVMENMALLDAGDNIQTQAQQRFEQMMGHIKSNLGSSQSPMIEGMNEQFKVLLDGIWVIAEATSLGSFMVMFSVGGFLPFRMMPSMGMAGGAAEKPWEKLKSPGGKLGSGKLPKEAQVEEEKILQHKYTEHDLEKIPASLAALTQVVLDKKKDFRDQLALKLMAAQEEDAAKAKHGFILEILQSYDAFPIHGDFEQVARSSIWFTALDAFTPEVMKAHFEQVTNKELPYLEELITRYHTGGAVLDQLPDGSVGFADSAQNIVTQVSDLAIKRHAQVARVSASSLRDVVAKMANLLQVPVVMIEAKGDDFEIYGAGMGIAERPLLPMQVWDIDWIQQRNVLYLNGGQVHFLMRPC